MLLVLKGWHESLRIARRMTKNNLDVSREARVRHSLLLRHNVTPASRNMVYATTATPQYTWKPQYIV